MVLDWERITLEVIYDDVDYLKIINLNVFDLQTFNLMVDIQPVVTQKFHLWKPTEHRVWGGEGGGGVGRKSKGKGLLSW